MIRCIVVALIFGTSAALPASAIEGQNPWDWLPTFQPYFPDPTATTTESMSATTSTLSSSTASSSTASASRTSTSTTIRRGEPICSWTATSQIRAATGLPFPPWNPSQSESENIEAQRDVCSRAGMCWSTRAAAWCFNPLGYSTELPHSQSTQSIRQTTTKNCNVPTKSPSNIQFRPWDAGKSFAWNIEEQRSLCLVKGFCFDSTTNNGPWCYLPSGRTLEPQSTKSSASTIPRTRLMIPVRTTTRRATTTSVTDGCNNNASIKIADLVTRLVPLDFGCAGGALNATTARERCLRGNHCWLSDQNSNRFVCYSR